MNNLDKSTSYIKKDTNTSLSVSPVKRRPMTSKPSYNYSSTNSNFMKTLNENRIVKINSIETHNKTYNRR